VESEIKKPRAPRYAKRSVWYVVIVLSIVVVVGFAAAGYELNHLRTELNGIQPQIQNLHNLVAALYLDILRLGQQLK